MPFAHGKIDMLSDCMAVFVKDLKPIIQHFSTLRIFLIEMPNPVTTHIPANKKYA